MLIPSSWVVFSTDSRLLCQRRTASRGGSFNQQGTENSGWAVSFRRIQLRHHARPEGSRFPSPPFFSVPSVSLIFGRSEGWAASGDGL